MTSTNRPGPAPAFFSDRAAQQQEASAQIAAAMSRNQALKLGFLKVEDLDDQELATGRGRGLDGHIPEYDGKTDMLPRDMYEAMVEEHNRRTNEKLRQQLDTALSVMTEIMVDPTVEPRDRFEASKYLFERVAGKTVDRSHIVTTKQPWEEVYEGIGQTTQSASRALRDGNTIDAEVVPSPYGHIQTPTYDDQGRPTSTSTAQTPNWGPGSPEQPQGEANGIPTGQGAGLHVQPVPHTVCDPSDIADSSTAAPSGRATVERPPPAPTAIAEDRPTIPEDYYAPPGAPANPHVLYSAPDFNHPRNTMATAPPPHYIPAQAQEQYAEPSVPLSTELRDRRMTAAQLAAARKGKREMIKGAKDWRKAQRPLQYEAQKLRIIKRNMGLDALQPVDIEAMLKDNKDGTTVLRFKKK